MKPSEIQFALNLETLSIPQCRRIVQALIKGPTTTTELSRITKLTPASLDKHLNLIKQAGLLKIRNLNGVEVVRLQISKIQPTIDWFSNLAQ